MSAASPSFGDLLRRLRSAASLSQEELAERAGLSVRGISDLERGLRQAPRLETVRLLADALGARTRTTARRSSPRRGPPCGGRALAAAPAHSRLGAGPADPPDRARDGSRDAPRPPSATTMSGSSR